MADLSSYLRQLKQLDDELITCMRCGMCQAVCPVFKQTAKEADVTRGKIALLGALSKEIVRDPEGVRDALNRCLMCGSCEANCPSGVNILDIFVQARTIMADYFGFSPLKKLVLRVVLLNPRLFGVLVTCTAKMQKLMIREVDTVLQSNCVRMVIPGVKDRHFHRLALRPLSKIAPHLYVAHNTHERRVAFFPGCAVDKMFVSIGTSILKIMEFHGVGVFMPANQSCCGIPALASGDQKTFNLLVEQNIRCFQNAAFDYLITPCASCSATIKELWPKKYTGSSEIRDSLEDFAAKTMDITEFLVDKCGVGEKAIRSSEGVTYHDPCHLKNALGISSQPRKIIQAAGERLLEMHDAGSCCGCGGTFTLYHPLLSRNIGEQKAENIIATGARTVATSCPACMMQLIDLLSHKNKGIRVKHVVELYAESLDSVSP